MRTHVINKWPLHIFTHTLTLLSFNRSFSYNYKKNGRLYCEWKCTPYFSFLRLFMLLTSSNESPLPLFSTYHLLHISFFETNINLWLTTTGIDVLKCLLIASRMFNTEYARWHITFHTFGYGIESLLHVYKNWNSG